MREKKTVAAFMYDFDNTLSTKDMQEYAFIPSINMDAKDFWAESNMYARKYNMDSILAAMYLMTVKSRGTANASRANLIEQGKTVEFHKGVDSWFDRINEFGRANGVEVQHYIISSGIKPIIEGTSIAKHFKQIFACDFVYDSAGMPEWPAIAVNYTSKLQFLYRINKGIWEIWDNKRLNAHMNDEDRPVPFSNMIYVGDGLTDVPCMKLTRQNGGYSIGVYDPTKEGNRKGNSYLMTDDRVNFYVKADYSEGSELEEIAKMILLKIRTESILESITEKHARSVSGQ